MRFIISLLSILLIFAGIAGVLYVDLSASEKTNGTKTSIHQEPVKSEAFVKKLSMREIDSITSSMNYSYTSHNAIAAISHDSLENSTP